jgi:hypothetical protein
MVEVVAAVEVVARDMDLDKDQGMGRATVPGTAVVLGDTLEMQANNEDN